ncbi:MAG: dipeptide ABC transporter ATP-binding protein [Gammaproteobacteria bacterium]
MSEPILSLNQLRTWFDGERGPVRAVDGVSLEINRGETFALLGESGCGKSMTAMSILQLLPPQASGNVSGNVLLEGQDLLALPEVGMRNIRGNRISMIFQEPMTSLNPILTIGEQIGETVRRHRGVSGKAERDVVLELLDAVGIADPVRRLKEYPHQLSGGMKQRVMIAIALAGEPEILIADEPTTALDVTIQAQVLALLKQLQRDNGMAILLITHDLGVVSDMADTVAVMYAGHLVEKAAKEDFFSDPKHPYSKKLFDSLPDINKRDQRLNIIQGTVPSLARDFHACRFAERCDFAWDHCRDNEPAWTSLTDQNSVRCFLYEEDFTGEQFTRNEKTKNSERSRTQDNANQKTLLDVENLKVHFPIHKGLLKRVAGYVYAVDGVSLNINTGKTLALVGESGCGKTTIGKAILQLIRPISGSVRFENDELTQLKGEALRKRRSDFQFIFQDPFSSMNPRMLVTDIIQEGMIALGIEPDRAEREKRVDQLLEHVGMPPESKYRYPHEFSGGQRQRICIARTLAVKPKMIICDEPTSALDISVQAQVLNLLKELQDEMGLSYLFITHNLSVVAYLADEVAVMYLGRIVEKGSVDDVLNRAKHPYTQALLSAIPKIDKPTRREVIRLEGDIPSPSNPPAGCHFHTRCPHVMPVCKNNYPDTTNISGTHIASCFLYSPDAVEKSV